MCSLLFFLLNIEELQIILGYRIEVNEKTKYLHHITVVQWFLLYKKKQLAGVSTAAPSSHFLLLDSSYANIDEL